MRIVRAAPMILAAALIAGCGAEDEPDATPESSVAHVHGLGVDPADESLIIATHSGLFRAPAGQQRAERIGDRRQDTMGFTVVGPKRYLGSGHPDLRDDLPPLLGLIRSDDAGRTWELRSLAGEADFHVLRSAGRFVYGVNSQDGMLYVSTDAGSSWRRHTPPGPLLDLTAHPADPRRLVASGEDGLYASADAGARWRPRASVEPGLMAWPAVEDLYLLDGSGVLHRSSDEGATFAEVGPVGGQPAAFAADGDDLYVALHTNEIRVSSDGGRTWRTRVAA